jgi:hypothetical protein
VRGIIVIFLMILVVDSLAKCSIGLLLSGGLGWLSCISIFAPLIIMKEVKSVVRVSDMMGPFWGIIDAVVLETSLSV